MTQELVGKDREINVILNREAALMENMLRWSFPPTLLFPWHHPAASSGSISGSPGLQRDIRLERQSPEGPKTTAPSHKALTTAVPTPDPSNPNKTLLLQQYCFQLFGFLKGHQAENPQPQTAVACNVQSCGSCLHCTVTDKFKS